MSRVGRTSILILLLLAHAGCSRKTGPETIFIAHLAPLSGPEKAAGEHARQAIQLAVEEVNNSDDLPAGRRVAVLHVDTRGNAETAQQEAVRVIRVNGVVALLGGPGTDGAERIGKVARQYGVPFVTPGGPAGDGVISLGLSPSQRGRVLGRFAASELKAERVAVLTELRDVHAIALADAFAKEFRRGGKRRVDEWTVKGDDDGANLAERLKNAEPQAFLVAGSLPDLQKLRARLRTLGVSIPALLGEDEARQTALRADREASGGVYLATAFVPSVDVPLAKEFAKKYEDRFKQAPDAQAAFAYDGVRLLVEALRRTKTATATQLRDVLRGWETFETVTGPLDLRPRNDALGRPAFVIRLEGGEAKVAKRYDPEKE